MPSEVKVVQKVWGVERHYHNDDGYCIKMMIVVPGYQSSMHCHVKKIETFVVMEGELDLAIEFPSGVTASMIILPGESVTLQPGTWHRFRSANGKRVVFVEGSTHDDPLDTVRRNRSGKIREDSKGG